MHVKEKGVDGKRQDDETQSASDEMFDDEEQGERPVTQEIPQLLGRGDADEKNDEQTDELGGHGAGEKHAAKGHVGPPAEREGSVGVTAELQVEESGGDDGEEKRRIEENVLSQCQGAWR